jgi:hypothetical protein
VARASRAIASWEWKAVGRMRKGLREMGDLRRGSGTGAAMGCTVGRKHYWKKSYRDKKILVFLGGWKSTETFNIGWCYQRTKIDAKSSSLT